MQIDVTYDSSVASAPAGFTAVIADVVNYYDTQFANPITVNIDVGWGEVDGMSLGAEALGESFANFTSTYYSYTQIKAALAANAETSDEKAAVATLPATDPTDGGTLSVTSADAKALGLIGASTAIDGWVGFSTVPGSFDFSVTGNSGGSVASSEYDFFAVVAHEFAEIMGRQMNFGVNYGGGPGDGSGYYPMDLYDFSASGVRSFDATAASRYFSINNGATNLDNYSTDASGDLFDWASSAGNDAYDAFSNPGVVNSVTATDLVLMNVLGYQPTPAFAASGPSLERETLTFIIGDTSQGPGGASTTGVYAAAEGDIPTTADTVLATYSTPAIAGGGSTTASVVLPLSKLAPGAYDIAVIADANGAVVQSSSAGDTSPVIGVGILDNANAASIVGNANLHAFDFGGLDLSGALSVTGSLYVASALSGSVDLDVSGGSVTFAPDASLGIPDVVMGSGAKVSVSSNLAYAGTWSQGPDAGPLTVGDGDTLDLTGVGDDIAGIVNGAGTLELGAGGAATFSTGGDLRVPELDQSGASVTVGVARFAYSGLWDQTAGTLSVSSGDRISFTGSGNTFAGTFSGAGVVALIGGSDTLSGATLSSTTFIVNGPTVTLSGAITLTNTLDATTANLIVATSGAILDGGGSLVLSDLSTNRVYGASASATLTNLDDRLYGAGLIGDEQMILVNDAAGLIDGDDATALVINTGENTILNAGIIDSTFTGGTMIESPVDNTFLLAARGGGTLAVAGAVTGAGSVRISGATADFESSFTEDVDFSGATGTLELAHSQSYAGTITGFSTSGGTSLDLADIAFVSGTTKASYSGTTTSGVLTVADGSDVAKIKLDGDYTTSAFTLSSDGHGATTVVDPPKDASAVEVARFASAIAGFTGGASEAILIGHEPTLIAPAGLAAPRIALA